MRRRTYLATLGAAATGGAFTIGTGAFADVWATRDTDIEVVRDGDGLIGLEPGAENGQFADTDGGSLSVDLSTGNADGVTVDTRTVVDDIFRIRNQTGDNQVIWIKDTTDDQTDLFGDEGPLHFFGGPFELTDGAQRPDRRVFSQLDPVPGTPADRQRLTFTGLVPPKANIGTTPGDARLAWINAGHPVTTLSGGTAQFSDAQRRQVGAATNLPGVQIDPDIVVGNRQGRFFFTPGEEVRVGVAADFAGFSIDENDRLVGPDGTDYGTDPLPDTIEIVSRPPGDARELARGSTEFNPI